MYIRSDAANWSWNKTTASRTNDFLGHVWNLTKDFRPSKFSQIVICHRPSFSSSNVKQFTDFFLLVQSAKPKRFFLETRLTSDKPPFAIELQPNRQSFTFVVNLKCFGGKKITKYNFGRCESVLPKYFGFPITCFNDTGNPVGFTDFENIRRKKWGIPTNHTRSCFTPQMYKQRALLTKQGSSSIA